MDATERLQRYAELVEGSPHNLLSRRGLEELRSRHIPESVALAALLPAGTPRVLDVGSGGGLPGMVVAIVRPEVQMTLLEATTKKADFLRQTAAELALPLRVVNQRAEQAIGSLSRSFEAVTARAVAPLDRLLGWTMPFLAEGGLLYAVKGERWRDELDAALPDLPRWRGEVVATPDEITSTDPNHPLVVVLRKGRDASGTTTTEESA